MKFLKELDFSIKEIRSILENCEEDTDMVDVLRDKEAELSRIIEKYRSVGKNINLIIKQQEVVEIRNRSREIVY